MTTVTPLFPDTDRLSLGLKSALDAFSRARDAMDAAPGATAASFSRVTIWPETTEAVDAIAAQWETEARWNDDATQYRAVKGDMTAEAEAVWIRPHAGTADTEKSAA